MFHTHLELLMTKVRKKERYHLLSFLKNSQNDNIIHTIITKVHELQVTNIHHSAGKHSQELALGGVNSIFDANCLL